MTHWPHLDLTSTENLVYSQEFRLLTGSCRAVTISYEARPLCRRTQSPASCECSCVHSDLTVYPVHPRAQASPRATDTGTVRSVNRRSRSPVARATPSQPLPSGAAQRPGASPALDNDGVESASEACSELFRRTSPAGFSAASRCTPVTARRASFGCRMPSRFHVTARQPCFEPPCSPLRMPSNPSRLHRIY